MPAIEKVAVFGLDCAEPSLLFDRWAHLLPNISRLMGSGTYGPLTSCMPPITVPAWSCMASSKDPGTLGIYGFRNRKDYSYDGMSIATSLAVRQPRLWDILSERGHDNIIIGVPGTYPIHRPPRGCMISCFLTPDTSADYTHPRELKTRIADLVGNYLVDVKDFRTEDKQHLLHQIYDMTDKRFAVARMLLESRPWKLFWLVEMGHDRIHHGFWHFMDPQHPRYVPGNPLENAIRDYYVHTDKLIGEALQHLDLNTTAVWIVSDHGARCMLGGFCFNQWLMQEGYLVLKQPVTKLTPLRADMVDWSRTRAWGEGGYYGRCFLNVKGREPSGIVNAADYHNLRRELQHKLQYLTDHQGQPMGTAAHLPDEIYDRVEGVAPDLIVIFGNLGWRSVGSLGHDSVYTFENDTGPDEANHAQQGLYVFSHPQIPARGYTPGPTLYDVAPTILAMLDEAVPADMRGRILLNT